VRYPPNWLSLSEARELLIASGLLASEAETDIPRALRERKIHFKRAIKGVTFRGHAVQPEVFRQMTVQDGNRFRLRVPADLAPEDLDWENSRPRRPWPLGEGYFAHIVRLELSRRDLEKVFSSVEAKASNQTREEASRADAERKRAEARRKRRLAAKRKRKRVEERAARAALEEASQASGTGRAQPRRYWARKAIDGAYPEGAPSKEEVPNKTFVAAVIVFAKTKKWNVGGPDTILREAGRRR
jgi:hypothetical protein